MSEKVALIGHYSDLDFVKNIIESSKPEKKCSNELLTKLFEWTPPYPVKEFNDLSFDGCRSVDAELFMVPFWPEMGSISVRAVRCKIEEALSMAAVRGCTIAVMGGFTSILIQGIEDDLSSRYGIRITSGNTLTAAMIIDSVEEIVRRFGIVIADETMAIIGASGDIGSVCMSYFCTRVRNLFVNARSMPTLEKSVRRCCPAPTAAVRLSADVREAIERAGICIFVTSAETALVSDAEFTSGAVVCDASLPVNVTTSLPHRDDVFIYHGGIATVPFNLKVNFDNDLPSDSMMYGCQLEGVLLGVHPELPCSRGRGNITLEDVERYRKVVARYPSVRSVFSLHKTEYDGSRIAEYSRRLRFSDYAS